MSTKLSRPAAATAAALAAIALALLPAVSRPATLNPNNTLGVEVIW